ncbi:MAG TPA: helix-turn-helix transcriptional regulator [Blastocatellia bacterium]|nr:helix-turn-helix transcriptional regulator [Blastocatellia bacterium]
MGRASRNKPSCLGGKLLAIRNGLGLSQEEMLERLGYPQRVLQSSISGYERGVREPPLLVLLEYAHLAGICLEILINDDLEMPSKLPVMPKHEAIHWSKSNAKKKEK